LAKSLISIRTFKLFISLIIIGLLTSCATVTTISERSINSFLQDLIKGHEEIDRVTIEQTDIYLQVRFRLKHDEINPILRDELFRKTRDYILSEGVKKKIIKELGNNKFNDVFTIRFQKDQSNVYWVYSLDTRKSSNWELIESNDEQCTEIPIK
jgi:hypothetical protein